MGGGFNIRSLRLDMSTTNGEKDLGAPLSIGVEPVTPVTPKEVASSTASPQEETSTEAVEDLPTHSFGQPSTSVKRSKSPSRQPQTKRRYARKKTTPRAMVLTLDTLLSGTVSSPMTALQMRLLDHVKTSLPPNTLADYLDISVAFKDFVKDEITTPDRLTKLLVKGGNAFFNHFMFTMYWGRDWRFATNETDMLLYEFDRSDWRGIHMAALCYPHIYRLMYRYVIIRVLDHTVLLRGQSWHMDPYVALLNGKDVRTVGGECIDKGCNRSIVMLESLCRCLVHQPLNWSSLVCRCCDDFDYYKKNTYYM